MHAPELRGADTRSDTQPRPAHRAAALDGLGIVVADGCLRWYPMALWHWSLIAGLAQGPCGTVLANGLVPQAEKRAVAIVMLPLRLVSGSELPVLMTARRPGFRDVRMAAPAAPLPVPSACGPEGVRRSPRILRPVYGAASRKFATAPRGAKGATGGCRS